MAFDLTSIKKGKQQRKPITVIFGKAGCGKSTFCCGAPEAIAIQTEDGLGAIDVAHFPLARSFDDLIGAIGTLYTEDHGFKSVVVDSLDHAEPLIWAEVCRLHSVDSIEKLPYGRGYVEAVSLWRQLLDGLVALRNDRDMWVTLIAHNQIVRIEDPENPSFDSHTLKLHKRASALVEEIADVVGFATLKTLTISESKGGFGDEKRTRAKTTGERILHVAPSPAFLAKSRYSLPPTLPLDWSVYQEAIEQSINPTKD